MKKLSILGLVLLLLITSCKTPVYSLGMSETEFIAHHKLATDLVEKSAQRTVYRRASPEFSLHPTYYYYFVDGKLVLINEGERKPYVIVDHTNN